MVDTRVDTIECCCLIVLKMLRTPRLACHTPLLAVAHRTTHARTELGALKRSVASNAVVSNELLATSVMQWRPVEEMLQRGLLFEKMKEQNRQMFYKVRFVLSWNQPALAFPCRCARVAHASTETSPVRRARRSAAERFGVGRSMHADGGVDTQLQELRGSIRVYCRIRPTFKPNEQVAACSSEGAMGLDQVEVLDKQRNWKAFTFDRVFGPKTSQVLHPRHTRRMNPTLRASCHGCG